MSKKSNRRPRQQGNRNGASSLGRTAVPAQNSKGGTKRRVLWVGAAVLVVAAVVYAVSGRGGRKAETTAVTGVTGPKIAFATPEHDFGQIKNGEVIKHAYVFTNNGSATLVISNVQTSCGCTTAGEWTRQVEPGKTGSIPIQFNSGSFSGAVGKSITVTCNDPNQPTVVLQIKGVIWKPIDVTPQYPFLTVTTESPPATMTVRIVNNEETPLTLSAPESNNSAFIAELKTNEPGKQFELIVTTVPPLPAENVQGQFTFKTSSTNLPILNVGVWARVQPVVVVTPPRIALPTAPLTNPMTTTVSIRNSGTNLLILSEPVVNGRNVEVQLKEIEAGRNFTLALNFPAGFEIAQGEQVELSVKSNHPQFPIIKVPVSQPPRPAPPAKPPGTPATAPNPSQ